ncbi:MAG: TonB-dependent receptor [Candidatus Acidiferrales bacterium]
MGLQKLLLAVLLLGVMVLAAPSRSFAQVNTVNLSGTILDPQNLAVKNATLTLQNPAKGVLRTATSDANGRYELVGLPPGTYMLTVEAAGFATLTDASFTLTLGQAAEFNPQLQLKTSAASVSVSAAPDLVETSKTDVSMTVSQNQIDNLPINGRNYINFTLLDSRAARDNTPSIGAAPNTGLNLGGQRGRSNEISVDGADAIDSSVNGVRATVSQEGVQEFQVISNSYMPEYGRAMGGVVNIVTKSGSNQFHGDVFGYLRDGAIQAQNPFSVTASCDPTTFQCGITPVKQSYTRVQSGVTLGGPIQKDKTFFFFSYEITRREETGFTAIGQDNFGFVNSTALPPFSAPCPLPAYLVTPAQESFIGSVPASVGIPYLCAAAASSFTAIFGNTAVYPGATFPSTGAPVPASFTGLLSTIGNFPTSEKGSITSLRIDHIWNSKNTTFIRGMVSPDSITGIQVNAENQTYGQNSGNRTSTQQTHDWALIAQHTTAISSTVFNEVHFQFARRSLFYGYSDLPGGSDPAVNIAGAAYFGREPFSTENRIEKRYQFTDNLTWSKGAHTFKFGGDFNFIQLGSPSSQIFTLNYGGVYDFGSVSIADGAPSLTPVQAYGLGTPTIFYQGIGTSNSPFNNELLGVFAQDSWKVSSKLTVNYGVRYDIGWQPTFAAATPANAAAEQAFGVQEGVPVDKNNVSPRIGIAWDPWGNGKTVIRAGYGFFYDNPALALTFLATAEDGARSALLQFPGGTPDGSLNAASIFQGILNVPDMGCSTATPNMCYQANQQRFNAFQPNSLFINQNYLSVPNPVVPGALGYPLVGIPYTIPITKNFQYALAQQANLSIERELSKDWKISAGYNYTHGTHLDRTININVTNPAILDSNAANAIAAGLITPGTNPLTVAVPANGGAPGCVATGTGSVLVEAPGVFGIGSSGPGCGSPIGPIGTAAAFNFFRPSGPNPSFAGLVGGYANLVGLAQLGGFPTGFAGLQVPWSDVNPQTSTGNSLYNAFTLTVTKRFSHGFEMLSGWTWSHTIDDSTDLSTLLNPQDNSNPNGDRGNSDFDQRHRWITSAVYQTPYHQSDSEMWKKILANFTISPVIELASGRPYNVLLGYDTNLDFGSSTGRPSVLPAGTPVPPGFPAATTSPFISGAEFIIPTNCFGSNGSPIPPSALVPVPPTGCTGDLGRNTYTQPGFFEIDLRIARQIPITERVNLQVIADGFNMLNRFNVSGVNPVCDSTAGANTCPAGQPTSAYDPRTFQFALKLSF